VTERLKGPAPNAPLADLTYELIGIAMSVHNELGPGHREAAYHNAMALKLGLTSIAFDSEPYVPVTLPDGATVRGAIPDFLVADGLLVELKAHFYTLTEDEKAQVIGYFAAFPNCTVALYFNFGRPRLEYHRLFPPTTLKPYNRRQWGQPK
jgi:GxxExxY protein